MEACVNNMVEPGDKAVIAINGVFGTRMAEVTRRAGAEVITVENEWGTPVDPGKVETALKANPDVKHVGFVHAETSTGVLSDAAAIANLPGGRCILDRGYRDLRRCARADRCLGADASTGKPKMHIPPARPSPVTFSDKAVAHVENRDTPVQSWLLDLSLCLPIGKEMARGLTITRHR